MGFQGRRSKLGPFFTHGAQFRYQESRDPCNLWILDIPGSACGDKTCKPNVQLARGEWQ